MNALLGLSQIPGIGWHTLDKLYNAGWSSKKSSLIDIKNYLIKAKISKSIISKVENTWSNSYLENVLQNLKKKEFNF